MRDLAHDFISIRCFDVAVIASELTIDFLCRSKNKNCDVDLWVVCLTLLSQKCLFIHDFFAIAIIGCFSLIGC